MEAEEMFNFTLGDNMECAGCKELQKIIDKHKEEKQLSFKTLKQKIISTDQLIKQYNAKREEYDQQSKMLEDVTRKLERSKRDTEMLEGQLQSALQQLEPLKKDIQSLNVTVKRKNTEIEMLNDKLKAADMLQAQFEAAARAHQAERSQIDRSDKEKKTLNKRIESLETTKEKLEKDVCKFKEANKLLKSENKTLQKNLDKAMKTGSNMVFLGGSPSKAIRGRKKGLPESALCKEKLPFSCASGTENELSDAVGIMDAGSSSEDEINFDVDFALSPLSNLLSPLPPTPNDLTVQEEGVIQGKKLQQLSDCLERLSDSESGEEDDEAIDEGAAALEELITDLLPNMDENVKLKSLACVQSMTEITTESEEMAKKSKSHLSSENNVAENEKISQEMPHHIPSNKINGEPIFLDGVPLMRENGLVEEGDKPKSLQALPNQMSMDHSLDDVSLSTESEDKVKPLQAHQIQIISDKSISDERFEINENKNHIKCSQLSVENDQMSKSQNVIIEETGCDLNDQKSPEILKKCESPQRSNTASVSVHSSSSTSLSETKQAVVNQVENSSHSGVSITPDCSSSRVNIASDLTLPSRESPDSTPSELVLTLVSSKREEIWIKNEEDDRKTLDLQKSEAVIDHNMVTEIAVNKELVPIKKNEIFSIVPDKEKEIISVVPNKKNEIVPYMEIEIVPKKENETDPKKEYETVSIVQNKKTEIVLKMENMVNEPESDHKVVLSHSKALSINACEKTQLKISPTCSHTSGFYPENVAANGDNIISHSSDCAKTLTQENSSPEVNENISSDVTIKETSVNGSSRADSHGTLQGSENIATKDTNRLVLKSENSTNERKSDPPEMNKNKCSVDTNEFRKSMNKKLAHPPNPTQNKEPVRTDLSVDDASCSSVVCKEIVNNDHDDSNINEGTNSSRSLLKSEISKSHVDHGETNIEETEKSQPFMADIEGFIGETAESFDNNESKTEMIEDRNSLKLKESKPEDVSVIVEDIKLKTESLEIERPYPEHVKKEVIPPLATESSNSENMINKSVNHMHDLNSQSTTDNSTSYCEDVESTIDKSDLLTGGSLDKTGSGGSMLNFEIKPETKEFLLKTSEEQKAGTISDEENEIDPNKGNAVCPNNETPPNIKIETVQKMNNEIVSKMDKVIVSNMENEIVRNNKNEIVLTIHEESEVIIGMKNDNNQVIHQDENKKDQIPKSVCLPLENNNCPKFTKDLSLPDDTATTAKSLDMALLVDPLVNDKSLSQPQHDPTATTFVKKMLNTEKKYRATASNDLKGPKGSETVASSETKIVEIFSLKKEANDLENISEKVKKMNGFEDTDSKLEQQPSIHQDFVPKMNGHQDTILQEINTFKPTNFQAENSDLNPNTGKMPLKNISDSNSASCTCAEGSGLDKVMVSTVLSRNIMDSENCRESNQTATDHLIQKVQEKENGFNNSSSANQLTSESEDIIATSHDFKIKSKGGPAVDEQEISRRQAENTTQIGNIRLCRRIAHVKKDATEPKDNNLHSHDQSLSDSFDTDIIGRRKTRKAKKRKRKDVKEEMTHKSPKSENITERGFNSDVNIDQTGDINSEKQASADSTDQLDKGFGKKPVMVTQKSTGFLMSGADLLTNATKKHPDSKTGKQNLCKNNNKSMISGSSGIPQIDLELPNASKSCPDTKIKLASLPSMSKDSVDLAEEFCSMDDFFDIFTLPASPFDMLDMLNPISPLPPSPDINNTQVMDDICLTSFCEEIDVNKSVTLNDAEVQMLPSFSDTNANSSIIKPSPIHPLATSSVSKTFPKESPQPSVKTGKIYLTISDQEPFPQSSMSSNYKVYLKSSEKETAKEVLSEHSPLTLQTQLNSCVQPSSQKDMKNLDDSITSRSELPPSAVGNKMLSDKILSDNTPFRMMTRRKSQLSSQIEPKEETTTVSVKVDEPKTDESEVLLLWSKRRADSGKNDFINDPKTDASKDHRVSVLPIQKHVSNTIESNVIATAAGSRKCRKGSSIDSAPGQVHKVSDGSAATEPMKSDTPNKYKQVICLSNTEVCELSQNRFSKRKTIDVSVDGVAGPSFKSVVEVSAATEPTSSDSKNKKVSKRKVTEDMSDNLSKKPKTETPQNDSCMDEASASSGINPHSLREDLVHMVKNGDIIAFLDKYFSNDEERTCSWRKVMLLIHEYLKDNKEMVSYENVSGKNRINMLDSEERICVLMNKITTNFQECGLDMLLDILWTSSTEDGIQIPSVLSMMRMYAAICRLKGNVELARVLLYHIMISVTDKNRLMNQILAIVGVWPLVLEKDFPKGSIMAQTLQHAILKLRVKLDTDGTKLLMKICAICNWPSDLPLNDNTRVQEKIIQYLKDHNNERERLYEGMSSLKLLLLGEEWIFIFREFIQRHVSSVCQRWTSKSGQGSDVVYVESILSVLADILIPCINPDFQHIKMILQTYLAPALNTITPMTSVTDCIAHAIMRLSPFAPQVSMVTLLKWFKKHKAVLPGPLKAQLQQTRNMLMEHFPNFRCGDFV